MYKPWICYRVRTYFIFFLFLILEILQKSELLPWFELKRGHGEGRGVGMGAGVGEGEVGQGGNQRGRGGRVRGCHPA